MTEPTLEIITLDSHHPLFKHAQAIRTEVFVQEQNCPKEEEWDQFDAEAVHMLAFKQTKAVGVLRCYDDAGWLHIGRLAVLSAFRGQGIARQLMLHCLAQGKEQGFARTFIHAQWDKVDFYRSLGYVPVGEEFMEAGIRHLRMDLHWG